LLTPAQMAQLQGICPGHTKGVRQLSFSQPSTDGVFFASACQDCTPMLRDGDNGDWIGSFVGHKGAVWSAHLNADGTRAVTGSADFTWRYWDATTGAELRSVTTEHAVRAARLSPSQDRVAVAGNSKTLSIHDLNAPESDPVSIGVGPDVVKAVMWSPDGKKVISDGGCSSSLQTWDSRTGTVVQSISLPGPVRDLDEQSSTLAVATPGHVLVFSTDDGLKETSRLEMKAEITSACLQPLSTGGKKLLVVGEAKDYSVGLHDASSGDQVAKLVGHHGPVHCVRFHPDGAQFASASDDATIRLWALDKHVLE